MRYFFILFAISLQLFVHHQSFAEGSYYSGQFPSHTPAFTATQLTIRNQTRNIWIYRPESAVNPPLLIFFSGTGGTLDFSTLDELGKDFIQNFADREGVVVAMPLPREIDHGDWDHYAGAPYWETATGSDVGSPVNRDPNNNPDLLLVQAVMDEAIRAYQIDQNRIYVNGFSSGAFFAYFTAAVLHERIAAFAETAGGLVLSNTTGGDPVCQINPIAAENGAVRNCTASGWTPASCVSDNAIPRPIAPGEVDWAPPAFLQANDDDEAVPFAHTCHLADALSKTTELEVRIVHQGGGHIVNAGFWDNAWNFMKTRRLETALFKAADRVFNYAENQYALFFAPANPTSQNGFGYYYRYYPATNSYLGYQNHAIWYYLPESGVREAGPLSLFLPLAQAAKF